MDLKQELEKQKKFIEMELAADTDSDAYKEDSSVEDEVEAELQEEKEEDSTGDKSNWGLQQYARSPRDVHRFIGHERGLRESEAPTSAIFLKK
jgi:hypothetical protein